MSAIDLEAFLHRLADASGDAILPFFRTRLDASNKASGGGYDPVTEADKAAEVIIRRQIADAFPEHGIEGEEFGIERADAEFKWIIDPIDGTRAFMAGLPVWGSLIGLMRNNSPVMGLMNQPFTRERYWGDGARAHSRSVLGERRIATRQTANLADAILATTSPKLFKDEARDRYDAVEAQTRLVRYGCDCYAYCMVAAGHIDLVIEVGLKSYDIAPLVPIIEGAGGVVSTWTGGSPAEGGAIIAAGDRRLHERAMKILSG